MKHRMSTGADAELGTLISATWPPKHDKKLPS